MKTTLDPKKLLELLLGGGEVPPLPPADVQRARSLLGARTASLDELESLPEPLALAVLEASIRARAARLPAAAVGSTHKALAKAAKKALYQLKSMGISAPTAEATSAQPPSSAPASSSAELLPCLLSAMTGTGERALFVVRPLRGGGLETTQVLLSDEAGILQLEVGEIGRSAYRRQVKVLREGTVPFLEIDLERAKQVLAEASGLNRRTNNALPAGAEAALRHLEVEAQVEQAPLPPPEPEDERVAANSRSLHDEPELVPWLPPEAQLRLLAQRLDEVETSPLALSPAQKREQLLGRVRATATEFFTPPMRMLYARRLWIMAEVFERTGRAERAQMARAEARRLFHAPGPGSFGEALFEKVLVLSERARKGQALPSAPGPSAGPTEPPPKTSPGGILLP